MSALLFVHICSGTVGLIAGAVSAALRKGSRRHGIAGDVFVVSMAALAITGLAMALIKHQPGNIMGGGVTLYLVATGWSIARRGDRATGYFDWLGLALALALSTAATVWAVKAVLSPSGKFHGFPPGAYLFLGSIALIGLMGDVRLLLRGSIAGKHRIARHLWRMCFAWFIGSASIFLARPHLFPKFFQTSGLLIFLSVLPLLLMVFWLIRVLRKRKVLPYKLKMPPTRESAV